jgi:hypothetical protein
MAAQAHRAFAACAVLDDDPAWAEGAWDMDEGDEALPDHYLPAGVVALSVDADDAGVAEAVRQRPCLFVLGGRAWFARAAVLAGANLLNVLALAESSAHERALPPARPAAAPAVAPR